MKIGDLVRYNSKSSIWYDLIGVVLEVSLPLTGAGSITHIRVQFQNGERAWTNDFDLEVVNESR